MGRVSVFMLDSFPIALLVSAILGFLSGLGVGGGSLLIIWLNLALGMNQADARIINLLFFLPSAAVSCYFRWKQGALNLQRILPAIAAGCVSAIIGFQISMIVKPDIVKKVFGWLLIVTAVRELSYWKENGTKAS